MRLFKRGNGFWYIEIQRGTPKSLKTRDKEVARRVYRRVRKDVMLGKIAELEHSKTVSLRQFADEYVRHRQNMKAPKTVKADELALRKLIEAIGDKKLSLLCERDFDQCIDRWLLLGNKASSVNLHLRHLRAAFSKAVRWDYLVKNPLVGYGLLKEDASSTRFMAPQDIQKVTDLMEENGEYELIAMLWFYLLTGCRRQEIFNLQGRDVHRTERMIHVRESKAGRERWIPISPLLDEVMQGMRIPHIGRVFGQYKHADTITHKVKEYLVKAGLRDFRLHDLRHSFASHLAMSGATQKDVKELLGHSDIRMGDRYTHLAMDHLRGVISNLDLAVNPRSTGGLKVVNGGKHKRNKN